MEGGRGRRRTIVRLFSIALFLAAGPAWAGAISGTVRDAATSAPLSGVNLGVFDASGNWITGPVTDASGSFSAPGLADGVYFVQTYNNLGYIDELYEDTPCLDYCDHTSGTPVTVSGPGATTGVDFALARGGQFAGTVREAGSLAPLADVRVSLLDSSDRTVGSAWSDASGAFQLRNGVPAGSYFIRTYNQLGYIDELYDNAPCASSCALVGATPITITVAAVTGGIDFLLAPGAQIAGTIRDVATSGALSGLSVQVVTPGGTDVAYGTTDAAGAYVTNPGLPAGTYFVRTWNSQGYVNELYDDLPCLDCWDLIGATPVVLAAPGVHSGVDFDLAQGGRISGTITDAVSGDPVAGAQVQVLDARGNYVSWGYADATGYYETSEGVPSGSYYVRTNNSSGYVNQIYAGLPCVAGCDTAGATPVAVAVGATTPGVDFALAKGGRVSGNLRDAVTSAPLVGLWVYVGTASGGYLTSGYTDGAGNYVTQDGLPSGTYYAMTDNRGGYINEVYDNIPCAGCDTGVGAPIAVTAPGTTAGVSFDLRAGGRISGRITDAATAAPLSGVGISVYNAAGTNVSWATSDAYGNYITDAGLPAGSYYLQTSNNQGYVNERYPDLACNGSECPSSGGTAVAVTLGHTTTGIDFALSAGGRISGTVSDALTGLPLQDVGVEIVAADGTWLTSASTNAAGLWISGAGLASGTYYAYTWNSLGYINQLWNGVTCMPYCSTVGGTLITVSLGATTPGVTFALQVGGSIRGTVTDVATSTPLANVTVSVTTALGGGTSASTDSLGRYAVRGLTAGDYYVSTSNSQGYINEVYDDIGCLPYCNATAGLPVAVAPGAATSGIDFQLAAGGRVSGRVTDAATGLPIGGVDVSVVTATGSSASWATSDLAGDYVTEAGLPPGSYYVVTRNSQGYINEVYPGAACVGSCNVAAVGSAVSVAAGSTAAGIDFALAAGGRVSGEVTDVASGAPIGSVNVGVFDATGRQLSYGYTDSLGGYLTQEGLPGGSYYLRTYNSAGFLDELYDDKPCLGSCTVTNGTPVAVSVGSTSSGKNFALAAGSRFAGHVRDSATLAPLKGVSIQLYDDSGRYVTSGYTDDAGAFLTGTGVPPGTYFARSYNSAGYVNELFGGALCVASCDVTSGTPIPVFGSGVVSGIDFSLEVGGRIRGTILDAGTFAPLASVSVQVYDSAGKYVSSGSSDWLGNYLTRDGLPSGSYYLRTYNGAGYVNKVYNNLACVGYCDVTLGTPVAVTAGATTSGIGFALQAGARVSGTVRSSALTPLASVYVELMNPAGAVVASATTDGLGSFLTYDGVPSGTYYVRTENSSGYVNQFWNGHPCVSSCTVAIGTPLTLAAPLTTTGIDFWLTLDNDALDGDGIANTIDRDAASGADESTIYSDDFNDIPLSGSTNGTISSRGGFAVTVGDISPGGVRASVAGTGTLATLESCPGGGPEGVRLDVAGETAIIDCWGDSTHVRAITALPIIELSDPPSGAGTVVQLKTDQGARIGSPVTADSGNTLTLQALLVDALGATIGSFELDPGESVDAHVDPAGTVTTTVLSGHVTFTVGAESVTLSTGETHTFSYGTATGILQGLLPQIDAFLASHDIRHRATAHLLHARVRHALWLIQHGRKCQARHSLELLIREIEHLARVRWVKPIVRDTLVPQLRAAIARL
jgi:hypothetical protein